MAPPDCFMGSRACTLRTVSRGAFHTIKPPKYPYRIFDNMHTMRAVSSLLPDIVPRCQFYFFILLTTSFILNMKVSDLS